MSITPRIRQKLKERDLYCWHCGEDYELVVHHRRNRGSGGSKLLDHYQNLIMVCNRYNFEMESMAQVAEQARKDGHKLKSWQDFSEPVYDRMSGHWYVLQENGTKTIAEESEGTIF